MILDIRSNYAHTTKFHKSSKKYISTIQKNCGVKESSGWAYDIKQNVKEKKNLS